MHTSANRAVQLVAAMVAVLLVAAAPAAAGVPLVDHIVDEFSVDQYTTTHHTVEDMGLGLYGGGIYNQGYRGRDASSSGSTDSLGNQECRLYLQDTFADLGFTTSTQGIYDNVVGELTGTTRPEEIFIIGAHYDTTTGNPRPGGDDNGSGTAAIVELARILSQYQFESTIRLIGFNTEEDGLKGSSNYVSNVVIPGGENVVGMISLDMILRPAFDSDPEATIDLDLACPNSADDLAWVQTFKDVAAEYVPELPIDVATPYTSSWGYSDHQPFANAGYASFLAIENSVWDVWGGSNDYYHTSGDWSQGGAGALYDYEFATNVTRAVAATLAQEAGIEPEPIDILAEASADWVYQNTPTQTAGRNGITVALSVPSDVNGNATYSTWLVQTGGPDGAVQIVETPDPMVWRIVGSRDGSGPTGQVTVEAMVGGNQYGGEGHVSWTVTVRPLGDATGDATVDGNDALVLTQYLNGIPNDTSTEELDFDGTGRVDGSDMLIMNQILNGIPLR